MKARPLTAALWALAVAFPAVAQEIKPVWVQHLNGLVNVTPEDKLPILVKAGGSGDATYGFSGRDVIDSYVSFVKYDDTRYLLGIRENGINEDDPSLSQEMKDRAAAFPDRSVVWIDAATGKSLGVALKTEIVPVALAAQPTVYAWWKFGVQDGANGERAIYTGFRYKVLRYAPTGTVEDPNFPNGRPTWSTTPSEAWVEPVPGEPSGDESSGGDGSASWRWKAFRVSGSGNDTKLWLGGGTWRASMQPQEFVTTDGGLTFQPVARMDDRDSGGTKGAYALGGQPSSIISTPADPARPGLQISYQGHYPGSGWEARPNRYTKNPQGDGTAPRLGGTGRPDFFDRDEAAGGDLPAFRWEAAGKDGIPINHKVDGVAHYDGNWVMTCDAKDGLDYIVTYAIPSWNQQFGSVGANWPESVDPNSTFKPGWIGVHTLDGMIASGSSAALLPIYETDEPIVDPNGNGGTGHDYGYEGDVSVYPLAGAPADSGKSLVLWAGGSYGFGVFEIENVAPAIVTQPANTQGGENAPVSLVTVVSGSPNKYQWEKDGTPLAIDPEEPTKYAATLFEGINKAKLTINSAQVTDSGSYVLKITNPLGNLETTAATLTVVADNTAPTIVSARGGKSPTTSYVEVAFSEPVTPETAGNTANYRLNGGATVSYAFVSSSSQVMLTTSALTDNTDYVLTVSGIRDVSANGNTIAANTQVAFKTPALTPGFLLWEMYRGMDAQGITGTAVDQLTGDLSYPDYAVRREPLTAFTTFPSLSNVADNFGGRISGWLTPTESGQYRFFIRSDDASELYLSTDDTPFNAWLIALEQGCCQAFLEPTNAEGAPNLQTSEPQTLTAGRSYYIAALYKEGGGGDHCEVAWRKEGDSTPAAQLLPIPGSFFKAYASLPAAPPTFEPIVLANGQVVITWTGAGTLEESTDLSTWTAVAGNPTSPYSVAPGTAAMKFYRLKQ
jgi:hypothetical protein